MKVCKKCGESKSLEEYNKSSNVKPSYRGDCKTCQSAYTTEYYKNEKNRQRKLANQKLRRYLIKKKSTDNINPGHDDKIDQITFTLEGGRGINKSDRYNRG